jgi:CubicO group peptidase (beta-lactamase class C family)
VIGVVSDDTVDPCSAAQMEEFVHRFSILIVRLALVALSVCLLTAWPFRVLAQEATPASPVSLANVQPLPLSSERQAELAAYIAEMLKKTGVPGAAVAVVQNGEVVYQQGFGVRELGSSEPVTPETLMMIGSITKSMTATMAATLVDSGDLTWETPVVDLLPAFAVADAELSQRLTIRNAFCACTRMPQRDGDFIFNSDSYTPETLLASVAEIPLTAPLGELFQYSNQMFAIGGYAAAATDGGNPDDLYDAYTVAMHRQLLDPLGMTRSTFALKDALASGNYSLAHGQNLSGAYQIVPLADEDAFVRAVAPAGALWSNAAEMARYLQTELARGEGPGGVRIVSEENLAATWQQQVAIPASLYGAGDLATFAQGYGLGWVLGTYHGQPLLWHNGGTFGFSSHLAFLPDVDLGIVVLTNGAAADVLTFAIQFRLFELLFDQPQTFDALATMEIEATAQDNTSLQGSLGVLDAGAVAPYLGSYRNDALGDVAIALDGGALTFDLGEMQIAMRPLRDESENAGGYLLAEPPFVGTAVSFAMTDGAPVMTLADSASGEAFAFSFVADTALVGTPAA